MLMPCDLIQDPSLSFQLQCRQQQVEILGKKWYRKLITINVGQKLDWPVEFKLAAAATEVDKDESGDMVQDEVDKDDDDDEIRFLAQGDEEFDAENTEVDDFVVDCLIQDDVAERESGVLVGSTFYIVDW
jgi:hypothetical protein